jgi:predicted transcriptional regulator
MQTLTLRLPDKTAARLDEEHKRKPHMSKNALIIEAIIARYDSLESGQAKETAQGMAALHEGTRP